MAFSDILESAYLAKPITEQHFCLLVLFNYVKHLRNNSSTMIDLCCIQTGTYFSPMVKDFWIPFNAECRSRIGWPAALKVSKDLEGAKIDDPERLCPAPVGAGFNGILGGGVGEELAFLGVLKSTGCVDILASKVLPWDYCVLRRKPPLLPLLPVPAGERLASGRSEENLTLDAGSSACATAWGEKKLLPWLCRCSYLERKPWKHHKRSKNSYSFWEMEREESRACSKSLVPDSMNRDRKVIGDVVATKATKGFLYSYWKKAGN